MIDVDSGFPEEGQYVSRSDEPKTFVLSDIHGNLAMLWSLLNQEGLVDDEEKLTPLGKETTIVSIGDLLNAVFVDVHGDESCAHVAKDWFDFILVGNHEWPYLFDTATFFGYYAHPPLRSLYNQWKREGFVRAAHVLGDNTFISHAGWARWPYDNSEEAEAKDAWEPKSAREAYDRATSAFERYPGTDDRVVLDMISRARGGQTPIGGILWSDWSEGKVQAFNQVVGHTPNPRKHPDLRVYGNGNWSLCIDSGCKGGGVPSGVWLENNGEIIKVVSLNRQEENSGTVR